MTVVAACRCGSRHARAWPLTTPGSVCISTPALTCVLVCATCRVLGSGSQRRRCRRDEDPTIWQPTTGIDHQIANRPAEVVEIQITHATDFAVRRRDRHPSQVTDTT